MEFLKLKSGTDIRGVASDGVAAEPVTLTDEVVEAIAASFLVWKGIWKRRAPACASR